MYLVKTPKLIQGLFPNYLWRVPNRKKSIFLTFDDGPHPEVTPWVLSQLASYNAKATFFSIGSQIDRHPQLWQQISDSNHSQGNHSFSHLNGWSTDNIPYFHDVRMGANRSRSVLFRPPYGRLKVKQAQFLLRHYQIVMWDVMSGDFDEALSPEKVVENVVDHAKEGSIVVFHDTPGAFPRLEKALPAVLAHFCKLGFSFDVLSSSPVHTTRSRLSMA